MSVASAAVPVESYLYMSECGVAAATALLVFDYCLTFRSEVEWLFSTRWTLARIHFTCSRYLPFLVLVLAIPTSRVIPPLETSYCGALGAVTNAMYYLCIILSEAMLAVRTYAFWKCDKRILAGMCTFSVVCMVVAIVPPNTISGKPTNSVYKVLDCVVVQGPLGTALQFTGLILYETGMLGLNWLAFRRTNRQCSPGKFITTLYHDGVMYTAAILLINASPIQYSDSLNSPQMVLHSVLASRIFLNLREASQQERENSFLMTLSEFRAASPTSDNSSTT